MKGKSEIKNNHTAIIFPNQDNEAQTRDKVNPKKKKRIKLSPNALKVLRKRYLKKNKQGLPVEEPEDMFRRVAKNIAFADSFYEHRADLGQTEEKFYQLMTSLDFLPNSPTLMNAGRELQQLSACFVLPIEDSMESIFETIKNTALIHKSGGGTGFSFSRLRPANSPVASTNGVSSGPISFMKVFDSATEAIKQGGTRRGANMGILRVDHPDILEFINCKSGADNLINNFNISVALTDDFMQALERKSEYNLVNPHTGEVVKRLSAQLVFDQIIQAAWKNGDPGVIFIDRINQSNPTPQVGEIESTNPCGEQPLLPYESCNLGSLNLANFVQDKRIDYPHLKETIHSAVHFLDNVIDMNKYPLKTIETITKQNRKIGLGVMGFADLLIKSGVSYNSEKAIFIAEEIMSFISRESKKASEKLAEKRGPFSNFKGSIYDTPKAKPIRNATTTTIAPTGTISIIANCSSGIEPLFALCYFRHVLDKEKLLELHPLFEEKLRESKLYSQSLLEKIAQKGELEELENIPPDIRRLFVTAHSIAPEWHIRMQAAFQKYTDNAVSKTINLKHDSSPAEVRNSYLFAYKKQCKGITIYRDGSRKIQVLNAVKTEDTQKEKIEGNKIIPRPRPELIKGHTRRMSTGCGNLYVTINEVKEGVPFEIFTQIGKAGVCASSQCEAIGRLVSLALRSNIEPEVITKQLIGITCHLPTWERGRRLLSCADVIGKALEKYIENRSMKRGLKTNASLHHSPDKTRVKKNVGPQKLTNFGICPDCSNNLESTEGCLLCRNCGYSKCG